MRHKQEWPPAQCAADGHSCLALLHCEEVGVVQISLSGSHVVLDELIVVQGVLGLLRQCLTLDCVAVLIQIRCGCVCIEAACANHQTF